MQKFLELNTPQFWSLVRTAALAAATLLAAFGITSFFGVQITHIIDKTMSLILSIIAIVSFAETVRRGQAARSTSSIAKDAVTTAKAETLDTLARTSPVEIIQKVAEVPAVAAIVTTSPYIASATPSEKVILDNAPAPADTGF